MVAKQKKKRKIKRAKKNTKSFSRKFKAFRSKLFEKIGMVMVFLVFLFILLGIVFFLWVSSYSDQYQEQAAYEAMMEARQGFINELVPTAQRLQREYGILTSVSLAQAALESNFGNSELSRDYNNLYGVKTETDDPDGVDFATLEFIDNEWIEIQDRFKVYPSWEASMESHAQLIYYGTSWDPNYYSQVLEGQDYRQQSQGLQKAGYATDPSYSDKLIELIEFYQLNEFDQPKANELDSSS